MIIDDRLNSDKYNSKSKEINLDNGLSLSKNSNIIIDDRLKDSSYDRFNFNAPEDDIEEFDDNIINKNNSNSQKSKKPFNFKRTSILLPVMSFIIVSILGMYLFVNYTKANTVNLIKIEQNKKIGYIDKEGTILVRPKYISGTDFYKGYAIVKNDNNLFGVINDKGSIEVPFGNYYFIGLFGNRYISTKYTNEGLKQGLLDEKLKDITKFKYDSLSYLSENIYIFSRDETMGIMNSEGKELYSFKVDEVDDKNISVEISDTKSDEKYARVKVNDSSTIINVTTGKEVYSYTLDEINVLDNNVFYINSENENNSTYIVIKNDEIIYKTDKYLRLRVDDPDALVALAIKDDTNIDYINLDTKKIINNNENNSYYYNEGLIVEKTHDFSSNKDIYNVIDKNGQISSIDKYVPVSNMFYNKLMQVYLEDGKIGFINTKGKLVTNSSYESATDFKNYDKSIVSKDFKYGILNVSGKELIPLEYTELGLFDEEYDKLLNDKYNLDLIMFKNQNNKVGILSSKNKIYFKPIYDSFEIIDKKYPIILGSINGEKKIINLLTKKELSIKVNDGKIVVKDGYIIIGNNYYNYDGKSIFKEE